VSSATNRNPGEDDIVRFEDRYGGSDSPAGISTPAALSPHANC